MRKFGKILSFGLLLLLIILALNFNKVQRLLKVNSLFEADNIVHNFSNMNEVLFAHDLPVAGEPHIWPENLQALPATVTINGQPQNLQAFLKETDTTALLVIKDGIILFEDYYLGTGRDDQRISWSMAKSYLSSIFGVAVSEGLIDSLDDPVEKYVSDLKGTAYEGASIRNVLNMASGVEFNEDYLDPNSDINKMGRTLALGGSMDEFAASLTERAREPGTGRQYVSIDTHVIGMVLRAVTGQSNHDYLQDKLLSKIGMGKDAYYLTDGDDVAFVLGGLNMRTRDYALFGQLFLNQGQYNGEQVIPGDWVTESTASSAPVDLESTGVDYGYQWWVPVDSHGDFFAVGIYSQYIYVDPKSNMVIVKNSADREFKNPSPSGQGYKLDTIDMFRSLAQHYSSLAD